MTCKQRVTTFCPSGTAVRRQKSRKTRTNIASWQYARAIERFVKIFFFYYYYYLFLDCFHYDCRRTLANEKKKIRYVDKTENAIRTTKMANKKCCRTKTRYLTSGENNVEYATVVVIFFFFFTHRILLYTPRPYSAGRRQL